MGFRKIQMQYKLKHNTQMIMIQYKKVSHRTQDEMKYTNWIVINVDKTCTIHCQLYITN